VRRRLVERGIDAISGHLDDCSARRSDRSANERVVAGERGLHALGFLFPQLRAALDVGKKEGDLARHACRSFAIVQERAASVNPPPRTVAGGYRPTSAVARVRNRRVFSERTHRSLPAAPGGLAFACHFAHDEQHREHEYDADGAEDDPTEGHGCSASIDATHSRTNCRRDASRARPTRQTDLGYA